MNLLIHPSLRILRETEDGYAAELYPLRFIVSQAKENDGKIWLHTSISRVDGKLPTYENLMTLKKYCIGEHRTALQVFPPKNKHINIAGKLGTEVLHLWCCLDGDVTPDFTRGGNSI
jgi:hypothetical protein